MIVYVQPMLSKTELNGDSNYICISSLVRAMLDLRPDWYFLIPWPDAHSRFKYEPDGFFLLPNVTRIPQRFPGRKMASVTHFDAEWHDRLLTTIGIDLFWCHLVESAHKLRNAGQAGYERIGNPYVVSAHHYVIHPTLPYPEEAGRCGTLVQLLGALMSDHNLFNSDYCARMLRENAEEWLSNQATESIFKKASVIHQGTVYPDMKPIKRKNDIPLIIYNHRLQEYKNWRITFGLFEELWNEGLRFRVRFTNSSTRRLAKIEHYPFVEVRMCADRKQYLETMREGDLNVTNSQHETFCMSIVESMAHGQAILAPHALTFPELIDVKALGYPYLFKTRTEQKRMLRELLTDHEKRARWGAKLAKHAHERFSVSLCAQRHIDLFEQIAMQPIPSDMKEDSKEPFAAFLNTYSGETMRDFARSIYTRFTVNGRVAFANQSMPPTKILRTVRRFGGEVIMRDGKQYVLAEPPA